MGLDSWCKLSLNLKYYGSTTTTYGIQARIFIIISNNKTLYLASILQEMTKGRDYCLRQSLPSNLNSKDNEDITLYTEYKYYLLSPQR